MRLENRVTICIGIKIKNCNNCKLLITHYSIFQISMVNKHLYMLNMITTTTKKMDQGGSSHLISCVHP